ncbi:MAG TPA: pitrilysin family protein, partial [Gemmatimonadaceae bacterium]|nr:pitrilysin family protein [Gemmatimonadaceae bacterium]
AALLGAAPVALPAQAATAVAPGRVSAAVANDTLTSSFEVAGIPVILRRTTANDVVAANLYLLGGARQVTMENAGIETFLLTASERGTRKYPKAELRRTMARLGTAIVVNPSTDWTLLGTRATTATFDSTWVVLADRLMQPTLDSAEVEQVRDQYLSAVRQRRESPDALLEHLADSVAFAGHPYGIDPTGSEQSIAGLTVSDLRRYQQTQMVRSRMLLVVVGNVERARVERLVRATIGRLPAGTYKWTPPPPLPSGAGVAVEAASLPTNYILGYFNGPPATSPDYQAMRIASAVLSGRLFNEIRVKRNLTYAVNSPFLERAIAAGGLYVTTADPNQVVRIMRGVVDELKGGTISQSGLSELTLQFITEYFLDNETNADQADFLAQAQLYRGDWRAANRFVDELEQVTPEDVRRVANSYFQDVRWAYVGDPRQVPRAAFEGF